MKKWTKVLSAFVVATVMSAGVAASVGCDGCGDDEHQHTYKTEWVPGENGHWHESDCGHENSATEPHVDLVDNVTKEQTPDGLCDVCGYDMREPTPPPVDEKVTVSFVTGTGASTVTAQKIDKGGKAVRPDDPTKEGYTFGGWFTDEACSPEKEFDFDTALNEATTLYAKWTENGEQPPVNQHLYEISAVSYAGEKLGLYSESTSYGLYSDTENFTKGEKGFTQSLSATLADGVTDGAYVSLVGLKGKIEGSFEFSASLMGSKWDIVRFRNGSKDVFCVRTADDTKSFVQKLNGTASAVDFAAVPAANTVYKVEYSLVQGDGGEYSLTLTINGEPFVSNLALGVKKIDCVYVPCSNASKDVTKARLITIDNVIIDAEVMTIDDYRVSARADIDAAYLKMVGRAAQGTEGEDGYVPEIVGTHARNSTSIKAAYDAIDLGSLTTIDAIRQKVSEFTALQNSVDTDAKITAAITEYTANIAKVKTDEAGKYTINKTKFDALIAEYEVDFASATSVKTVTDTYAEFEVKLAAIDTDVQDAAKKLKAAKDAALNKISTTEAPDGATADIIAAITKAQTTAAPLVEAATTVEEVNEIMADFDRDVAAALSLGDLDANKTVVSNNLTAYAKAITDALDAEKDAALISSINSEVATGKAAIEVATTTAQVAAASLDAETKIDRLVAKDTLAKYAASKEFKNKETYAAITDIKTAINSAVSSGNTAIDAATKELNTTSQKTEIQTELEKAQSAVDTAYAELENVTFKVTINGVTVVTVDDVNYGQKVVLDESGLADNVMVTGWFTDAEKTKAYNFDTLVYDDLTLYATTADAVLIAEVKNTFDFSKIDTSKIPEDRKRIEEKNDRPDNVGLLQSDFDGTVNSFLTVVHNTNDFSADSKEYVAYKTKKGILVRGDGLSITFDNPGTLTIKFASTGSGKPSRLGLKDSDGNWIEATTTAMAVTDDEEGCYEMTGTTAVAITFNITKKGTYTISCPSAVTTRGAVISAIEQTIAAHKVACDVSVKFGDGEVQKYYHKQNITAPAAPQGNGEFIGWFLKDSEGNVTNTKFEGTLDKGSYEFVAKFQYTVHITYNDGSKDVDLYLNVENVSDIAAELPTLPAIGNQIHAGWKIGSGDKIDFATTTDIVLDAETPNTYTLTPVYEESTAILVENITITGGNTVAATGTLQLTATATAAEGGTPDDGTVTWSSSDETLATVDANGLVTAKNTAQEQKTVTITATAKDASGITQTIEITIEAAPATVKSDLIFSTGYDGSDTSKLNVSDENSLVTLVSSSKFTDQTVSATTIGSKNTTNAILSGGRNCTLTAGEKDIVVKLYITNTDSKFAAKAADITWTNTLDNAENVQSSYTTNKTTNAQAITIKIKAGTSVEVVASANRLVLFGAEIETI